MKHRIAALLAPLIAHMPAFPRVWGMTAYYHLQRLRGFPQVQRRFRDKTGYELNLDTPRSLNEKLTHRRLYCRDPKWIEATDKVAARDWLQRKGLIGDDLKLIPVLGVFRTSAELRRAKLPKQYIVKGAWASGRNIIVKNGAADLPRLTDAINRWLVESPVYRYRFLIWASWFIPRRIIVEEFLVDEHGTPPADYKFFVFQGRVRFFYTVLDRFGEEVTSVMYDRDQQFMDVAYPYKISPDRKLADNVDTMIEVAERVGAHFDFVRVDLYSHAGNVYFGELTMTPMTGCHPFQPSEFDVTAGEYWDYPPSKP